MARSIVAVVLRSLVVLRILVARVVGSTETCVGLARIKGGEGRRTSTIWEVRTSLVKNVWVALEKCDQHVCGSEDNDKLCNG